MPLKPPAGEHRKILVPFDFSDDARRALNFALQFGSMVPSDIYLFAVLEPVNAMTHVGVKLLRKLDQELEEMKESALAEIDRVIAEIGEFEGVDTIYRRIANGNPVTEILGMADNINADFIVMGTQGQSKGISTFLIGSVTEKVVRRAPCTVIVVKDETFAIS